MNRTTLFFCFCLTLLSIEIASAQVAADFYFPLRVGNYWNYYTPGRPNGWSARTTRETIDGTDLIAGQQYYRLKGVEILDTNPSDTSIIHVLWLRQDSVGNIVIGAYSDRSTNIDSATLIVPPGLLFPNEFLTLGYSREFFGYQDSVLSTTETVNVPAGTFTNCLKIRNQRRDSLGVVTYREYSFYARNIGEVMRVREIPVNQVHTDYLIQYSAVTSVEGREADLIPRKIALLQNYPNPFNPSTTIRFSLPQRSLVTLKVLDMLGREVATLVDGEMDAGEHSVVFNTSGLSSGVYFYRLKAGNFVEQKKMVFVK
jgi:hypothetical protein